MADGLARCPRRGRGRVDPGRYAVAVGLSPLAPFGAVRPLYPDLGVAFDWTVLGLGFAVLVVVLLTAVGPGRRVPGRAPPCRLSAGSFAERGSSLSQRGRRVGRPAVERRARHPLGLGTGAGRDAAPVRSAISGAVLAVVVRRDLDHLRGPASPPSMSQPAALRVELELRPVGSGFSAAEDLPAASRRPPLLDHDPGRRATGRACTSRRLEDRRAARARPRCPPEAAAVVPTPHAPAAPAAVGVTRSSSGPPTLAALTNSVGDTVVADTGGRRPVRLRVVRNGDAADHRRIGSTRTSRWGAGAVMASSLFPARVSQRTRAVHDRGSERIPDHHPHRG